MTTGERGSVFILSLWMVLILSLLSLALAHASRQQAMVFQRLEQRQELKFIAHSAIKKIMEDVLASEKDPSFIQRKKWYDKSLGPGSITIRNGEVNYILTEEENKININTATQATLARLFKEISHLGDDPAARLAASFIDFRDSDDFINTFFDKGSELDSYQRAGLAYGPKNTEFECLSEVMYVKGMTPEIFKSIEKLITIYGAGGVDLNTADKNVLIAAGLFPETADKILRARRGTDNVAGTADDHIFENINTFLDELAAVEELTDEESSWLDIMARHGYFVTSPTAFRLKVEATMAGRPSVARIECVFGHNLGVQYWLES